MNINGFIYNFRFKCITCDAPAKSLVRVTKLYNALHGCVKCLILGKRIQGSNVFIGTNFIKRTNSDFRTKQYPLHYNCNTPLK